MGFYIRKGINFGPLRFNMSKSGVGVSAGVRGLRVGMGPRGTYLHAGRGGVYYRQSLDNGAGPSTPAPIPQQPAAEVLPADARAITSAPVSQLTAGNEDFLADLNARVAMPSRWLLAILVGVGGPYAVAYLARRTVGLTLEKFAIVFVIALFAGIVFISYIMNADKKRRMLALSYELDENADKAFRYLNDAFERLKTAGGVWHVAHSMTNADPRYHGGATGSVSRNRIAVGFDGPKHVTSNLRIPSLPAGVETLYFFPDRILVWDGNRYGAVLYADATVQVGRTHFHEEEFIPQDATVIGSTWRYVNKSGDPDRRFRDNRQIPVLLYFTLGLSSSSGLCEAYLISNEGATAHVQMALDHIAGRKAVNALQPSP